MILSSKNKILVVQNGVFGLQIVKTSDCKCINIYSDIITNYTETVSTLLLKVTNVQTNVTTSSTITLAEIQTDLDNNKYYQYTSSDNGIYTVELLETQNDNSRVDIQKICLFNDCNLKCKIDNIDPETNKFTELMMYYYILCIAESTQDCSKILEIYEILISELDIVSKNEEIEDCINC